MEQLATQPQVKTLSAEERNDLRRRVLSGYQLTLEEARAVVADARQGRGVAAMAGEAKAARGKGKRKVSALTDEALDASLKEIGL